MKNISISKIFTILLVLYPVIYVYDSPVGPLSLADTLLILLYPFLLLNLFLRRRMRFDKLQLFLAVFVTANLVLMPILGTSSVGAILRNQVHFLLVLVTLAFFVPNMFNKELGIKLLCYVSLISSIYLIVQDILLHAFGIVLRAHLPFLTAHISVNGHIRPFAFFSEPAAFGMFNAVGLTTFIFLKPFKDKTNRIAEMIISLGMMLSLSSTAVALLAIVWICQFALKLRMGEIPFKVKSITFFAVVSIMVLFLAANSKMNIVSFIYQHVAPTKGGGIAGGVSGRIGNISGMSMAYSFSFTEVALGHGMIDLILFLPATARTYLYFGVIGCIILILYFLSLFKKSEKYGRVLIIVALANSLFADSIFGLAMFWYMQYVMLTYRTK